MSASVWYFIERKDENGNWQDVNVYIKGKDGEYKPYDWETGNADYALFDLIFDKLDGAYREFPNDLGPAAFAFFDKDDEGFGKARDYCRTAWYDIVELRLLVQMPQVIVDNEWYEDDPENEPEKINGLKNFMDLIEFILAANGIWYPVPGEMRVLCAYSR